MAHIVATPTFADVFDVGPCHEALFENFSHKELVRLARGVANSELRDLVVTYLERYPIRAADVAAGEHVALLHRLASVQSSTVRLLPATYRLEAADTQNAAHVLRPRPARPGPPQGEPGSEGWLATRAAYGEWARWEPSFRVGLGPLKIAAGVQIIGQEGAVLDVGDVGFVCKDYDNGGALGAPICWGAHFKAVTFSRGVVIPGDVPSPRVTISECAVTGREIRVLFGANLAMKDCRIFGVMGNGMHCEGGQTEVTRCTFENNAGSGVRVGTTTHGCTLTECVLRNNERHGVVVAGRGTVKLSGGTVSGNQMNGVLAQNGEDLRRRHRFAAGNGRGGKVNVEAAEVLSGADSESEETEYKPTVCTDNELHNWAVEERVMAGGLCMRKEGEIEGLAEGVHVVAVPPTY